MRRPSGVDWSCEDGLFKDLQNTPPRRILARVTLDWRPDFNVHTRMALVNDYMLRRRYQLERLMSPPDRPKSSTLVPCKELAGLDAQQFTSSSIQGSNNTSYCSCLGLRLLHKDQCSDQYVLH